MTLPHKCAGTTKNRPERSRYKGWGVGALKVKPGCWEVGAGKKLRGEKGPTFLQATRSKTKAQGLKKIRKAIDARPTPNARKKASTRSSPKRPNASSRSRTPNPMRALFNPEGDKATERTPLERAPVSMDHAIGAEVGKVIELALPDLVVKFGRSKPPLLWFPEQKALGFFMYTDGDKTRGRPDWLNVRPSAAAFDALDESADVGPAVKAFKKFMGRGPEHEARTYEFPYRSTRDWYSINRIKRIDYWSDKFRAEREYTHEHGPGVRLYIYGSPRRFGPSFWLIRGGGLTVTERGILN